MSVFPSVTGNALWRQMPTVIFPRFSFSQRASIHSVATWPGPLLDWLVGDRAGIQTHSLWLQNPQFFNTAIFPLEVAAKRSEESSVQWNSTARTMWLSARCDPHGEPRKVRSLLLLNLPALHNGCGGVDGAFSLLNQLLMEEMRFIFISKNCRITWGMKQRAIVLTLFILFLRTHLPSVHSRTFCSRKASQGFLTRRSLVPIPRNKQAPAPPAHGSAECRRLWGCHFYGTSAFWMWGWRLGFCTEVASPHIFSFLPSLCNEQILRGISAVANLQLISLLALHLWGFHPGLDFLGISGFLKVYVFP